MMAESNASLCGVGADMLEHWRPIAWPHLREIAARSRGRYVADDLWRSIELRDLSLWMFMRAGVPHGVILTEILNYPRTSEAVIFGAAGHDTLKAAGYVIDLLSAWAKANGCTRLVAAGRKGWARALPGMQLSELVVGRELADG